MAVAKEHDFSDEDIPSDFFDDFSKDEFMDGLSVIDSWDDRESNKRRIDADVVDSVDDLRELIREDYEEKSFKRNPMRKFDSKYKWVRKRDAPEHSKAEDERRSSSRIEECTKPGSRRDPNKTNQAIKKDKEKKVKEYLAKHLDSSDDLKPPGTELDDFFEKPKESYKNEKFVNYKSKRHSEKYVESVKKKKSRILPDRYNHYPQHRSPRWSPRHSPRKSPYRTLRHHSPSFSPQWKEHRTSHHSPYRHHTPRRSPIHRSPHRSHNSRSPKRIYHSHRSRSRSHSVKRDSFLYPTETQPSYSADPYSNVSGYSYTGSRTDFASAPVSTYINNDPYSGGYTGPYEYGMQGVAAGANIVPAPYAPQPVPQFVAPVLESPVFNSTLPVPAMVPPPALVAPREVTATPMTSSTSNALAKLVAEGKLSQQDYLKLTPNKGKNAPMDTKTRVVVLNRCHLALSKLSKLVLPNRLIIHNSLVGNDTKSIAPKYCSPLKRQARVDFEITKPVDTASHQNKQLVDSIIASIGLDKVVARPKKKALKNIKDASTQTSRPFCDVCEIRESTKLYDAGTSIDLEHFQLSEHTQVDEQDLVSSKSMFNPSGSIGDSGPISIAHLTPAQLVSQLAARAKTLKQSDPPPPPTFGRRNPSNSYNNYDPRGGNPYNYNNYRY